MPKPRTDAGLSASWRRFGYSEPEDFLTKQKTPRGDIPPSRGALEGDSIQGLTTSARRILRLEAQGLKPKEIATHLSMSSHSISIIRRNPLYKIALGQFMTQVDGEVVRREATLGSSPENPAMAVVLREAERSAEAVVQIRDDAEKDETRLRAAVDILDRAGVRPMKVTEEARTGVVLSDEQVTHLSAGFEYLRQRETTHAPA